MNWNSIRPLIRRRLALYGGAAVTLTAALAGAATPASADAHSETAADAALGIRSSQLQRPAPFAADPTVTLTPPVSLGALASRSGMMLRVSAGAPFDAKHTVQPNHTPASHDVTAVARATLQDNATVRRTRTYRAVTPTGSSENEQDLYWLARVIEAEAGGEPMEAKIAVGDVVVNRVHSREFPHTVKGVIFQREHGVYEFTTVENGRIYHTPSADSIAAAKKVLYQHVNVVPSALVFYNDTLTPAHNWVRTRPVLTVIGHLTFAR